MLLDVEDLAYERDGRAGGEGSHGMQGRRKHAEALARPAPAQVEDADHSQHHGKARAGADLVPVGRDKECYAAGQQDGPQNQHHKNLPAQACGLLLLAFPGADAAGSLRIQDAGRLPAG